MIYTVGITSMFSEFEQCTIEDVVQYCKDKGILGVDTETSGLDFTIEKIVMFQIGDDVNQYIIDTRFIDITPLKEILESKDIIKIFHNVKFDYKFIRNYNIICENIWDTMLVEQVLNCGRDVRYGLTNLTQKYLNIELNKEVRNKFINLEGAPYTHSQIIYGANDIAYLITIREHQIQNQWYAQLLKVVELENQVSLAFGDIEYNGMELDTTKWRELEAQSMKAASTLKNTLDSLVMSDLKLSSFLHTYIQTDMFTPTEELRKVNVKWSSPKQVLAVFKTLVPELENVNGKEMYKYASKFDIIKAYIKYKGKMKLATSYGEEFLKNLKGDGKIHTSFFQILDTGRVSSSKPNVQQIPADNTYRNCFIAPKNWKFVSADYNSQELNVIAYGSRDPVWLDALEAGVDLHSLCAELVFGDEWANANAIEKKKLRGTIKTISFGLA